MAELANRLELVSELQGKIERLNKRQAGEFRQLLGKPPDVARVKPSFWDRIRKENEEELAAALLLIFIASYDGHRSWGEMPAPESTEKRDDIAKRWVERRAAAVAKDLGTRSMDILNLAGRDWEVKSRSGDPITQRDADELADKIFGTSRAESIALTETQTAMVGGGDAGIKHSGVEVTVYWGHTSIRPPGHSGASLKPCPICTPREGLPESRWGAYTIPAHPRCDCFKVYVDADGFVVGTDSPGMIPGDNPRMRWAFKPKP